jgi:hypothetical protein
LSMLVLGSLGILLRSTEVIHQFEKWQFSSDLTKNDFGVKVLFYGIIT